MDVLYPRLAETTLVHYDLRDRPARERGGGGLGDST
jgi:hypothetical protein